MGDIKACVISELKGTLAAPEKASDNLQKSTEYSLIRKLPVAWLYE